MVLLPTRSALCCSSGALGSIDLDSRVRPSCRCLCVRGTLATTASGRSEPAVLCERLQCVSHGRCDQAKSRTGARDHPVSGEDVEASVFRTRVARRLPRNRACNGQGNQSRLRYCLPRRSKWTGTFLCFPTLRFEHRHGSGARTGTVVGDGVCDDPVSTSVARACDCARRSGLNLRRPAARDRQRHSTTIVHGR